MPVVHSTLPVHRSRQSRRLRHIDSTCDDDLWETYDAELLDSVPSLTVKSEPNDDDDNADVYDDDTSSLPSPSPVTVRTIDPAAHVPRPRNAFICFRSEFVRQAKLKGSSKPENQTCLSRDAADAWRGMNAEERRPHVLMALQEKREHALRYPNYKYAPGSGGGGGASSRKVNGKKVTRMSVGRRASSASSDSSESVFEAAVDTRPWNKYVPNPPAPREKPRRKSTTAKPQRHVDGAGQKGRATVQSLLCEGSESVIITPTVSSESSPSTSSARARSSPPPSTSLPPSSKAAAAQRSVVAVPLNSVIATPKENDEPTITPSPIRPCSYNDKPKQFGFKKRLSPNAVDSIRLPTPPPTPPPVSDRESSQSESPDVDPQPQCEWDSWMYVPMELNDDEDGDLDFSPPPKDFGFYCPAGLDGPAPAFALFA
ncbi:putative transcription factor SOX-14 [Favolaschia claudopus]|uniref:Transcription factor SOX-14 n=1 Tax=Favolaschia claudopus TaxID=2862362 RepID=A0AAW0CNX2_9AGAR